MKNIKNMENRILPNILILDTKGFTENFIKEIFEKYLYVEIKRVISSSSYSKALKTEMLGSNIDITFISKESSELKRCKSKPKEHTEVDDNASESTICETECSEENDIEIQKREVSKTILYFHSEKLFNLIIGKKINGDDFNFDHVPFDGMDPIDGLVKPSFTPIIFGENYSGPSFYTEDKVEIKNWNDYIKSITLPNGDLDMENDMEEYLYVEACKGWDYGKTIKEYNSDKGEKFENDKKNFMEKWKQKKMKEASIFNNFFNINSLNLSKEDAIRIVNNRLEYIENGQVDNPEYVTNKQAEKKIYIVEIDYPNSGEKIYEFRVDKITPFKIGDIYSTNELINDLRNDPPTDPPTKESVFFYKLKSFLTEPIYNKIEKVDKPNWILKYSKLMVTFGEYISFPKWLESNKIKETFSKYCSEPIDVKFEENQNSFTVKFENVIDYSKSKIMFSNFLIYQNKEADPTINYRLILNRVIPSKSNVQQKSKYPAGASGGKWSPPGKSMAGASGGKWSPSGKSMAGASKGSPYKK